MGGEEGAQRLLGAADDRIAVGGQQRVEVLVQQRGVGGEQPGARAGRVEHELIRHEPEVAVGGKRTRPSATARARWAGEKSAVSSGQMPPTSNDRTPPGRSSPAAKNSTGSPAANSWAPSRLHSTRVPNRSAKSPACR